MLLSVLRYWRRRKWLDRIDPERAWQKAERAQAAEHAAAVRRIIEAARADG